MNKLFTKIATFSVGLAMAVGVGVAVGASRQEAVPVRAANSTTTMSWGGTSTQWSFSDSGSTYLEWTHNSTGTTPIQESDYRMYSGADLTIKAKSAYSASLKIKSLAITGASSKNSNSLFYNATTGAKVTAAGDGITELSWDTSSSTKTASFGEGLSSVTVARSTSGNQVRVTQIVVTYEYTPATTYTITYNSNGGSGTMSNTTGENPSVAECTFTAPSSNKTFSYWHTAADGVSGTTYSVGAQPKQNLDLYAIWKDKPTLLSIAITTPPSKTSYNSGESFDSTGMVVTATYSDSSTANVVGSCTFSPSGALSTSDDEITVSYTYEGVTKTATQSITVTRAPGLITFGSASGNYNFASAPYNPAFTDNLGNTVTTSVDTTGNITATQIGKGGVDSTATVTITLGSRSGIESVTVNAAASQTAGTVNIVVYGDTTNDAIFSSSVTGQSYSNVTVGNSYSTINADQIVVVFSGSTGLKPGSISYSLTDTVQEFGTLDTIEVKAGSTHETTFKLGQTFSSTGLIILATDTADFTKDFTSGFTTDYDGHEFVAADVNNSPLTVTVSLTVKTVTKTVTYEINVINPPTYSLADDLYEGMKVILVESGGTAVGAYGTNQYAVVTDTTVSAGVVTDASTALEFTVRIFGESFGLQYGDKYLSYSGSSNEAYQSSTLNANASWKHDGTGLLWCGNESAGRYFQINGVLKAACYTSTQKHLSLYVSSASTKTDPLAADTFTYRYLHMRDYLGTEGQDGSNYCKDTGDGAGKNYFSDAVTAYASLSTEVKTEFKKNTEAVKRFQAWADANGKTINLDTGVVAQKSNAIVLNIAGESSNVSAIIIIVSLAGVTAVGGYFFLRKRKIK